MPHLITPHLTQPWDIKFTLYACLLHIILVNKDLCFALNAHEISNSELFLFFFHDFLLFNIFPPRHLFAGHGDLRILRANSSVQLPRVSFLSGKQKPNLNTVNSIVPFPFLSPRGDAQIVHENSHCTGLCSVRCRGGVSAWEYTSSIFG